MFWLLPCGGLAQLWKFCLGTYCIKLLLPETNSNLNNPDYSGWRYCFHIKEPQISLAQLFDVLRIFAVTSNGVGQMRDS